MGKQPLEDARGHCLVVVTPKRDPHWLDGVNPPAQACVLACSVKQKEGAHFSGGAKL